MTDRPPLDDLTSDQLDALYARAEQAEAAIARARTARRRISSALIAVESLLTTPYPDNPHWTPWSRFVQPALNQLTDALQPGPAATEATEPPSSARDLIAAAIYEHNNPRHPWSAAHPDDRIAYGGDADAVLAVILPGTRITATLARMADADVQRVIALYERWVEAGPPPLGTPMSRWWDARLVELHDAILPPAPQTEEASMDRQEQTERRADITDGGTARTKDLMARRTETLRKRAEGAEGERDAAYRERAHLVALLAAMTDGAVIAPASDVDEPGWQIAYLNLGGWQASWHIHPRDADLFVDVEHVPADHPSAQWDGHTTEQKYAAIVVHTAALLEERERQTKER
jgi:hypothetical protein